MINREIIELMKAIEESFAQTEFSNDNFKSFKGFEEQQVHSIMEKSDFKARLKIDLHPIEYFVLICSAAPFLYPATFKKISALLVKDKMYYNSFGGKVNQETLTFYPSIESILFFLLGHSLEKRLDLLSLFKPTNPLFRHNLLQLSPLNPMESPTSRQIYPTAELMALLQGEEFEPEYSTNFPASRIQTKMNWEDLVLPHDTLESLEELNMWMEHGKKLNAHPELLKKVKPGYRVLFYGPSGTGKTLTASLIGKTFNLPVYRVDLSMVVSKWVGETEKNLKQLFDIAENKNWILFFDEADSIFGKRTQTNSSNDKYANQEVSYLLQRIEDFPGLVILASNLKSNIDTAFNRRFQATIHFPMPDEDMRYMLWEKAFPEEFRLHEEIDIRDIARNYELAGGAITNIIRYCVLKSLSNQDHMVNEQDLRYAIVREFKKSGKMVK
ncbi:ATP-binding protein [Persicobacter sp. CCB-QB2]|uniref:ATP-binding protein n=1 Tax=Persicobacter sp. CCB-QB2 TaxID=1561025 RepID=UPI0006A9CB7F|nr:ATP-binding protein [Persicobacter sp. CCB-QB2]